MSLDCKIVKLDAILSSIHTAIYKNLIANIRLTKKWNQPIELHALMISYIVFLATFYLQEY